MTSKLKILIVLLFTPIVALLLVALTMLPMWIEGMIEVANKSYPIGNPDNLTFSQFLTPITMVLCGVVGLCGLINFLINSKGRKSILWTSDKHYATYSVFGLIPCIYVSWKNLPGVFGYYELIFTLLIPAFTVIYLYKYKNCY